MSNLLILVLATIIMSCSSLEDKRLGDVSSPGYQYGRQMDERSMRAGFLER